MSKLDNVVEKTRNIFDMNWLLNLYCIKFVKSCYYASGNRAIITSLTEACLVAIEEHEPPIFEYSATIDDHYWDDVFCTIQNHTRFQIGYNHSNEAR